VKNGSCQSGVWRKQWGTDTRVVTATATSCGQAAPPSNGDYSFAICPIGYNVTGGGSQLVQWNPANEFATNAAEQSYPVGNGWAVLAGAKSGKIGRAHV